jgi:hypothetical protein
MVPRIDTPEGLLLEEEDLGSGERCQRCGVPLYVSEGRYCGVRKGAGMNCSAIAAREVLAVTGVQSYATQMRLRQEGGQDGA